MGHASNSDPILNGTSKAVTGFGSTETSPCRRILAPLPTKADVEARLQSVEAYITTVPTQSASDILRVVDATIRPSKHVNLHHLRRFVKPGHLPSHLNGIGDSSSPLSYGPNNSDSPTLCGGNVGDLCLMPDDAAVAGVEAASARSLHFLICVTSAISVEDLRALLLVIDSKGSESDLRIHAITVPLNPPSSEDQAKRWSQEYWPTTYKGGNPFGPHPVIVDRACREIESHVDEFMDIARRVGLAASAEGRGEPFGAVAVDRSQEIGVTVIAAAGDARWDGISENARQGCGNVMAHAVLRVIGMVALKRLSVLQVKPPMSTIPEHSAEQPITQEEKDEYVKRAMAPGGYLCLDLELYLTHEPCIMCCMAINHSRFGRVVFGKSLPLTGGLTTEQNNSGSLNPTCGNYGLWWREELNWKYLVWHWIGGQELFTQSNLQNIHA